MHTHTSSYAIGNRALLPYDRPRLTLVQELDISDLDRITDTSVMAVLRKCSLRHAHVSRPLLPRAKSLLPYDRPLLTRAHALCIHIPQRC